VSGYSRDAASLPPPEWLRHFWGFVGAEHAHLFNQWPIIPLTTGELVSAAALPKVLVLPVSLRLLPDLHGDSNPVNLYDFGTDAEEGRGEGEGGASETETNEPENVDRNVQQAHERLVRVHPVFTALRRLGCKIVHPDFSHVVPRPETGAMARQCLSALSSSGAQREPLSQRENQVRVPRAEQYMYIYVYSYICTYAYIYNIYVHIYIHIVIYIHMYIYIYVCVYIYIYICTYMYMYTLIYIYVYIYIHVYIPRCTHTYLYIYIYRYMHIHICIHVYRHSSIFLQIVTAWRDRRSKAPI